MRLTVGPLAPAVYWRRRAVILGAVLVVLLLITYACSGDSGAGDGKNRGKGGGTAASSAPPSGGSATPGPSVLSPTAPEPSVTPPVYGEDGGAGGATGAAGNGTSCSDAEIAVVPALESASVRQGVPVKLFIKIKNVSERTCVRDVGAQMQELYMQQGTTKHWSSDACDNRGSTADVVTFPPGHERSYWSTWEGKANGQGCTNQPWLATGTYQLYGRLGTKVSEPVTFTVTA